MNEEFDLFNDEEEQDKEMQMKKKGWFRRNWFLAAEGAMCIFCTILMSLFFLDMQESRSASDDKLGVDVQVQDQLLQDSFTQTRHEKKDTEELLEEADTKLNKTLCLIVAGEYASKDGERIVIDNNGKAQVIAKNGSETKGTYSVEFLPEAGKKDDPYRVYLNAGGTECKFTVNENADCMSEENGKKYRRN